MSDVVITIDKDLKKKRALEDKISHKIVRWIANRFEYHRDSLSIGTSISTGIISMVILIIILRSYSEGLGFDLFTNKATEQIDHEASTIANVELFQACVNFLTNTGYLNFNASTGEKTINATVTEVHMAQNGQMVNCSDTILSPPSNTALNRANFITKNTEAYAALVQAEYDGEQSQRQFLQIALAVTATACFFVVKNMLESADIDRKFVARKIKNEVEKALARMSMMRSSSRSPEAITDESGIGESTSGSGSENEAKFVDARKFLTDERNIGIVALDPFDSPDEGDNDDDCLLDLGPPKSRRKSTSSETGSPTRRRFTKSSPTRPDKKNTREIRANRVKVHPAEESSRQQAGLRAHNF